MKKYHKKNKEFKDKQQYTSSNCPNCKFIFNYKNIDYYICSRYPKKILIKKQDNRSEAGQYAKKSYVEDIKAINEVNKRLKDFIIHFWHENIKVY
jgi:hypothetical protein